MSRTLNIEIGKTDIINIEGNFVTWQRKNSTAENKREIRISRFENVENATLNTETLSANDITNDLSDTDYLKLLLSVAVDKWNGGSNKCFINTFGE